MLILQWFPSQSKMSSIWKVVFKLQPKKPFQGLLFPKLKNSTQNRANRDWLQGFFRSWVFCRDIKDPLNINEIKSESSVWSIIPIFNGLRFSHKIDIGAKCNVVVLKIHQKINPQPDLDPENLKLSAYNTSEIPVIGKCSQRYELLNVLFLVVYTKSVPILVLESCKNIKIIKRICSVESKENSFLPEFSDSFGEIGTLNNTYQIKIKENFIPVVTPGWRILHLLKPEVEKELNRMVDFDIIGPVDEPTDWVNGLVIAEKPNRKLRIYLDSWPLNQAIKREHLHLHTAEKLFSQMLEAKYFLKLDTSSGYWQIKVDRESSNLLSFWQNHS